MSSGFPQHAERPGRGEIWWSSPSYEGPAGYEECDRMLFVVLDESHEVDRTWFGVAPIWPDADLANELDLILEPKETTLDFPARVQLRRRITLAWEQLETKMGEVEARGLELIDAAIRGEADLDFFGIPYESEHDWRIAADRWAAELVGELQGPYFAALQEVEEAIGETGMAPAGGLAEIIPLVGRKSERAAEDHEFALAAADKGGRKVIEISADLVDLRGYLWPDLLRGVLELHIDRVASDWRKAVELLVGLHDGRLVSSPAFVPKPGLTVDFGEGEGIRLGKIDADELRLRVIGG